MEKIATAIGAYLAFDYNLALLLLGLTVILMVFRRGFIISGLGAFLLLPIAAHMMDQPACCTGALAAAAAIIIFAHRERIRKTFAAAVPQNEA